MRSRSNSYTPPVEPRARVAPELICGAAVVTGS
jgi:hypothetical protein